MQNDANHIGTTGEAKIAEAMKHFDSFFFDVLADDELSYADAPEEDTFHVAQAFKPGGVVWPEIIVTMPTNGGVQKFKLNDEIVSTATSKTGLRKMIAALAMMKPNVDAPKGALLHYLIAAVDRLTTLSTS